MSLIIEAAAELQSFFEGKGWRFCIIGGVALLRWGEPRMTRDVDAVVLSGFGHEESFISELLRSSFQPRIPDAGNFALRSRVLLLRAPNGVPIDISFGGLPFEESCIDHATNFEFEPGRALRTCSAEDLIVLKLFAARERDVLDVQSVVQRRSGSLDWPYIEANLTELSELREGADILTTMRRMQKLDRDLSRRADRTS